MAAFTSTQDGDWNDGATWGNTSPGVKGTDWPGGAGQDDTASVGHTVTYNVSETNEMGDITITNGGILTFKTDSSTKLTLGDADITINSGGELRVGASGAVIGSSYTAELIWNTTGDNADGITVDDGGVLNIYGDPAYYGSDGETTLANDADNTDDDAYIVTSDDMSSHWNVGDEITIKRENQGDNTSDQDATVKYTIQSISGTTIELDANFTGYDTGIGDTWASPVVNVTRNVKLSKSGADTAFGDGSTHYNSNRPRIDDNNTSGNNNCVISNAMITGFNRIDSGYDFQFLNSTFRNGNYGLYTCDNATVSGNVYGNNYGLYSCDNTTVSGNVYGNNYGAQYCDNATVSGNVYGNYSGLYSCENTTVSGNVYGNYYGARSCDNATVSGNVYGNYNGPTYCDNCTVSGRIGYDAGDNSNDNNTDFDVCRAVVMLNAKLPSGGLSLSRNSTAEALELFCEHHDRTLDAQRIYWNMGNSTVVACDGTGDRPSQDPDGGSGNVIELSTIQSNCEDSAHNRVPAWKPHTYRIWAAAADGQKTYTFKIQTTYSTLTSSGLRLTAEYLDGSSGGSKSEVTDDSGIAERSGATDWTQSLAVDVNPSEDGWIDFKIELYEYESGDEVWIWPEVGIS